MIIQMKRKKHFVGENQELPSLIILIILEQKEREK